MIDAVLDEQNVADKKLILGHPLLKAAMDALKYSKYEPTYLNQPVGVELVVTVTFHFN